MGFLMKLRSSDQPLLTGIVLLAFAAALCFASSVDSAGAQSSDDHGNTLSTATVLPLDSSIGGRIDPGDDRDVFKLDLSSASGNTHVWLYTTGTLDTWGGLYDSSGDRIAFNDDTTLGGEVVDTNFRIPRTLAPGVYYAGVFNADGITTGNYTLHAKTDDHGASFPAATALGLGSSTPGVIEPEFDRDVFKLDLSGQSGTTDVWIYTSGGLDTRGWLYDSSGGPYLVFNDDSYIDGRETGFNIRRRLASGIYYISVRSWEGAAGDYTLHAAAVTDPGSTTATAALLNLDSPTPGAINSASDADYFRLTLPEPKNLLIYAIGLDLRDPDGFLPIEPLDFALLDNNGAEVSVNVYPVTLSGDRWGFLIQDDFDRGPYFIKVTTPTEVTSHPVHYTIHALEDSDYAKFINDCEASTAALANPEIDDSLFGCQWHLRNLEQQGEDVNVEGAWEQGFSGEGVNVAVIDDTIDYSHRDLTDNVNSALNHDYQNKGGAFRPFDHHSTAVAGVIAARDNGTGVLGVAPRATIYGYNLLVGAPREIPSISIADSMSRNRVATAVSNNSWGPTDSPGLSFASRLWESAVDAGIREGYGGKGVFYVFAGGNGGRGHRLQPDGTPAGGPVDDVRYRGDYSSLDEIANHYAVTAVCAVNDAGARAVYSEKGANLWVCGPSGDDGERRGIATTENSDRYRDNFSGTSASVPAVSGVAALLRQANPDLTWRDLKLILAGSARKNDPENAGWAEGARKYEADSEGDVYHFNHEYGFGVVDAKAAVDLAREWVNVPDMASAGATSQAPVTIPPPSGGAPQTVATTLTLDTDIRFTEFVEIKPTSTTRPSGTWTSSWCRLLERCPSCPSRSTPGTTTPMTYALPRISPWRHALTTCVRMANSVSARPGTWERTPTGNGRCG